jgi:hypothetical protein
LRAGQHKRQNESNFGSRYDATWGIPVPDTEVNDERRRKNGKPVYQQRQHGDRQGNGVVTSPLILQAFNFALGFALLETDRTNMSVVESNIAQGA